MAVTTDKESKIRRNAQPQAAQQASEVSYYASRSLSGAADVGRAPQTEPQPVQAPPHAENEGNTEPERARHDISRLPITTDARDESGGAADSNQATPEAKDGAKPAPEDAKPQSEPSVAATTDETQASDKAEDQSVARTAMPEAAAPEREAEEDEPAASLDVDPQELQEQPAAAKS